MNHSIFSSNNTKLYEILDNNIIKEEAIPDSMISINTYNALIESANMTSEIYDAILSSIHEGELADDILDISLDTIKGNIASQCIWFSDKLKTFRLAHSANVKLALDDIYKTLSGIDDSMFLYAINPVWYTNLSRIEDFFDNLLTNIKPFDIDDNFKWYKNYKYDYDVVSRYNISRTYNLISEDSISKIFTMDETPLDHGDGIRNANSMRQMLNQFSYSISKNNKWLKVNSIYYERMSKAIYGNSIINFNKGFDISLLSKIINAFENYRNIILNILIIYQKESMRFLQSINKVCNMILEVHRNEIKRM